VLLVQHREINEQSQRQPIPDPPHVKQAFVTEPANPQRREFCLTPWDLRVKWANLFILLLKVEVMTRHEILSRIREHDEYLLSHGVQRVGLFGSHARGDEREGSDIDLIVEFDEGRKNYDNFIELCFFLEDLFGRKVDLLTPESLSPFMRDAIEQEAVYETIH
jgi:predicted nucleotidyltransferase